MAGLTFLSHYPRIRRQIFLVNDVVGFYGPKFEYQHDGTTLLEYGRVKIKEQTTKWGRKTALGCRATWSFP